MHLLVSFQIKSPQHLICGGSSSSSQELRYTHSLRKAFTNCNGKCGALKAVRPSWIVNTFSSSSGLAFWSLMHEQVHDWHNFTPWQALPTIAAADVQEICCLHSFQGPTGNILLWSSGLQRRRDAYNAVSDKTCVDWQMTRLLSLRLAIRRQNVTLQAPNLRLLV